MRNVLLVTLVHTIDRQSWAYGMTVFSVSYVGFDHFLPLHRDSKVDLLSYRGCFVPRDNISELV